MLYIIFYLVWAFIGICLVLYDLKNHFGYVTVEILFLSILCGSILGFIAVITTFKLYRKPLEILARISEIEIWSSKE